MTIQSFAKELLNIGEGLSSILKEIDSITDDSIRNAFDDVERDLDVEFSHCVDKFYREYDPEYYDRTYALYEGYKFDRGTNGLSLNWETSGTLIPDSHRASPEYIFNLTYKLGQHGGSIKKGLWRTAIWDKDTKRLTSWEWGDPTKKGMPIDFRINQSFIKYKKGKKLQSYFESYFCNNFYQRINKYGLSKWF